MIIYKKQKQYSLSSPIDEIADKLDSQGVRDFDTSDRIDKDCVNLVVDPKEVVIYLPLDQEYSQFRIDLFIRSMVPSARTSTVLDRNIFVMKVHSKLTEAQIVKLVKFIIEECDFCLLIKP